MEIWDAEYEWIHYNTIAIAMPMPMMVAHVHIIYFSLITYDLFAKEGEAADDNHTCQIITIPTFHMLNRVNRQGLEGGV